MPENCNPNDCPLSPRVDALEKEFDRYRSNSTDTHKQMFDRIGALEQGRTRTETKLDSIDEKLDELSDTMKALVNKPAKRWDKLTETILAVAVTAILAFLLGRIGL